MVGALGLTEKLSFGSGRRSPVTRTVMVLLISPGAKVSVSDVARESVDVVMSGNDLLKFVETLQVARRCRRII